MRGSGIAALIVVVLSCFIQSVNTCSCFPAHPQQHFCDADFALRGSVTKVTGIPYKGNTRIKEWVYTVKVLKVFKGKCNSSTIKIKSATSSARCGVYIDVKKHGRTWLFTGTVFENTYSILSCGWNAPWKGKGMLSLAQKHKLTWGVYAKNCKCAKKIMYCPEGNKSNKGDNDKCNKAPKHGVCKWASMSSPEGRCYARFAFCGHCKKGYCMWRHHLGFRRCMKKIGSKKG